MVITKAYVESDIIWDNLKKSQITAIVKRTFLFIALLIISFLLITPTYAITVLDPIKTDLQKNFKNAKLSQYISEWFSPLITLTINFGMIPSLIDFSALLEDYRRKSSLQISIMRRIFFFMFVNTLIIPLANNVSVIDFIKQLGQNDIG